MFHRIVSLFVFSIFVFCAPASFAQTNDIALSVLAHGQTGDRGSSYAFKGQINDNDGTFTGEYEFDVPGEISAGTWRAAAKRLWDVKLRWGTPNNPPPIASFGNYDLTIDSWTTMIDTGRRYNSSAWVGGAKDALDISLRYEEPAQSGQSDVLEQTSYSTFVSGGHGRILFQTSHSDADGRFAFTRGVILLRGAPKAVLTKPVHTRFTVKFQPEKDARSGRFTGQTEVIAQRTDLPSDQATDLTLELPTDELRYCCSLVCTSINPSSCTMKCDETYGPCQVFTVDCPGTLGEGGCTWN